MAPVDDGGVITDRVEVKLDKIKDFIEKFKMKICICVLKP